MKVCAAFLLIATAAVAADVSDLPPLIATNTPIVEPDAIINDADRSSEEIIDEYKLFTTNWWKYVDLAAGLSLGMYQPYVERARSYDCNSEFMGFGL